MLPKKDEIRDKVVLVGLNSPVLKEDSATDESMEELSALVETAGGEAVGIVLQTRGRLSARARWRRCSSTAKIPGRTW